MPVAGTVIIADSAVLPLLLLCPVRPRGLAGSRGRSPCRPLCYPLTPGLLSLCPCRRISAPVWPSLCLSGWARPRGLKRSSPPRSLPGSPLSQPQPTVHITLVTLTAFYLLCGSLQPCLPLPMPTSFCVVQASSLLNLQCLPQCPAHSRSTVTRWLSLGPELVYLWLNTRCPGAVYLSFSL